MFFKKKAKARIKINGRKTAEMGVAAVITGVVAPSVKKLYDTFFEEKLSLTSLSLEDLVEMDDDEGDEYDY